MHLCGLRPRKDLNLKVSSSPHHQNKYNGSSKQPYFAIALNVKVYKLFCENKVADILNDPCHSLIETVPAATIFRKHNFQFGGHGAKLPATMQTPGKETKRYTAIMCQTSPSGYLFKPPASRFFKLDYQETCKRRAVGNDTQRQISPTVPKQKQEPNKLLTDIHKIRLIRNRPLSSASGSNPLTPDICVLGSFSPTT